MLQELIFIWQEIKEKYSKEIPVYVESVVSVV